MLDAATDAGVVLRATGGLAVWLRCPSARRPPLEREFKDLDLFAGSGQGRSITALLSSLGYAPDEEFNQLHGHQRLYFWDAVNGRQLDVFIERIKMSHELDLTGRIALDHITIPLADLLLTKLQVYETNEKDLKDAVAILADHALDKDGVDPRRIASVLAGDWGWWRTATVNLDKIAAYAAHLDGFGAVETVVQRAQALKEVVDQTPKSLKWRMRAKIGERVRWYELPEEIEG